MALPVHIARAYPAFLYHVATRSTATLPGWILVHRRLPPKYVTTGYRGNSLRYSFTLLVGERHS